MEECNCEACKWLKLQELYEDEGAEIMEQHKHKKAKRVVKKEKDNPSPTLTHDELINLAEHYCVLITKDVKTRAEALTVASHIHTGLMAEAMKYHLKKTGLF